ncbi:hypothetical protein PT974_07820 [Cladobotryum mycophilum]|uniref:DUF7730 domain-containing protein n=1 Tax=Cladobotryum mycophilum TaxID=491253 RepID=A0ABR0SIW2_9HYPO
MPNAIKVWFKRMLGRRNRPTPPAPPAPPAPIPIPPTLPSERPGQLTPSPSCENLASQSIEAQAESSFFRKLPIEIRRAILMEAFGNRTLHMDLVYDHPASDNADETSVQYLSHTAHGDMKVMRKRNGFDFIVDESRPKQWNWHSSICHRTPPQCMPFPEKMVQPGEDHCRFGWNGHGCSFWPGEYPAKWLIGVMGWLLSCRQAYAEAIDILYSTNTIHTASKEMMMHIDKLLVPQRLTSIRSVELCWELKPYPGYYDTPNNPAALSDMASFHAFLKAVPTMFPNARALHISLRGITFAERSDKIEEDIMEPLDTMIRTLGSHVRDFSVGVSSMLYILQRKRVKEAGWLAEQDSKGQVERYWRPLDGSPLFSGYWVMLGEKNLEMPWMWMFFMGSPTDRIGEDDVFYRMKPY